MDDLLQIASEDFWDNINHQHQNKGVVYKIIAVRNGQRQSINRFLGTEREGVHTRKKIKGNMGTTFTIKVPVRALLKFILMPLQCQLTEFRS